MIKKLAGMLSTPLLQLHGAQDECTVAPTDDDAGRFEQREPSQASIVLILLEASSPKGHKGDPVPEYELDPGNNRWMPHRHGSATYEVSFIG